MQGFRHKGIHSIIYKSENQESIYIHLLLGIWRKVMQPLKVYPPNFMTWEKLMIKLR